MISILKWGNATAFYFIIIPILLCVLYIFSEKFFQKKLNNAFGSKVASYLAQSLSLVGRRVQILVQFVACLFLIIAMARPQAGESMQEVKSEGVELLILADVSESMLAEDVKPSRLAQMKIELSKLLELMPGNKIGIIAFAGSSSLLSPLTSDPNALRMYIDSLDADSVSSQGTNFESALQYAKEAFAKGGVTQAGSTQTTRVVLVASDGEDQEKGALELADKLSKEGIKIFGIAYGTEKGGAIPIFDRNHESLGFKKDASGAMVITQVKGEFLKSLTNAGGGQFYFSDLSGEHLKKLVGDIGQLEKTQFQSSTFAQYEEKFTLPLLIGLILILGSLFISDRRLKTAEWKGKYEAE